MIILILLLCFADNLFSQGFIGIQGTNRGAGFQFGILTNQVEFTLAHKIPFTRADVAEITSFSVGKQFLLSQKDADNYSVTTHIGIANYRNKNFSKFNTTGEISQVIKFLPIYTVEIGKNSYAGRIFLSANYCKEFYFGIGLKTFPSRL